MKRCLFLCMYGWLIKIKWNIITWKRIILQSFKYGRFYWCRLCTRKKCLKEFDIKNLGEYHDLYVEGNTLMLADVFEIFPNVCLKIYKLGPACFLSAPVLARQTSSQKKSKIRYFSRYRYVINGRKSFRRRNMSD